MNTKKNKINPQQMQLKNDLKILHLSLSEQSQNQIKDENESHLSLPD